MVAFSTRNVLSKFFWQVHQFSKFQIITTSFFHILTFFENKNSLSKKVIIELFYVHLIVHTMWPNENETARFLGCGKMLGPSECQFSSGGNYYPQKLKWQGVSSDTLLRKYFNLGYNAQVLDCYCLPRQYGGFLKSGKNREKLY